MENPIELSEINKTIEISTTTMINNEIKITNTSAGFINNLKIYITDSDISIIEQSITRQRGCLDYSPSIRCLEVGNLAPNETAYFEYKFASKNNTPSLSNHLTLSYLVDSEENETSQEVQNLIKPFIKDTFSPKSSHIIPLPK